MTPDLTERLLLSLMLSEKSYLAKVQNKTARWIPQSTPQWLALLSRADELFYGGQAGGGKACYTGTVLPTPDGWIEMQDVNVGDYLFSADGAPCKVLAVSEIQENHDCYEVVFDDGEIVIADAEHRWLTLTNSDRASLPRLTAEFRERRRNARKKRGTGKRPDLSARNSSAVHEYKEPSLGTVKTTKEIYDTLFVGKRANHSIPLGEPLCLPEINAVVPPYTLGAWLGDGKTTAGKIYCHKDDTEILDRIRQDGFSVTGVPSESIGWTIGGLQKNLREIGVLGNKHIPSAYLRASYSQRMELLRGLMDTDGTCDKDGGAEYTTILPELAKNVLELARTLGLKATLIEGRAMLYGKDCGAKYRIKITTNTKIFNLARKRDRQSEKVRQTQTQRYIIDCRPAKSVPVKCVAIDAPSHLYLVGSAMIPTHNSDLLLGTCEQHHRSIIFRRVFPNLRAIVDRSRQIYNSEQSNALKDSFNESLHTWKLLDGKIIEFGAMQYEQDRANFQGRPHDFIGFDEITEFTESQYVFVAAWNRTTEPGQRVRVIVTGNPPMDEAGAWVIRRWGAWLDDKHPNPAKPGELRWYATIDGDEKEFTTGEPVQHKEETIYPRSRTFIPARLDDNIFLSADNRYRAMLQSLPEPMRSQLLNGDFHASAQADPWQIIPTEWVRAAQRRWLGREKPTVPLTAVGLDPARGGRDNMSMSKRYDNYFDEIVFWPGAIVPDGPTAAELVRQSLGSEKPGRVNVDIGGIGSSAYDSLVVMYNDVNAINAASSSDYRDKSGKLKMRNMRAEYYWRMRDALDPNGGDDIALPPGNEIVADLCSARYSVSTAGVLVESKEEIKKRLGRSPDKGESILLANLSGGISAASLVDWI